MLGDAGGCLVAPCYAQETHAVLLSEALGRCNCVGYSRTAVCFPPSAARGLRDGLRCRSLRNK